MDRFQKGSVQLTVDRTKTDLRTGLDRTMKQIFKKKIKIALLTIFGLSRITLDLRYST